jgi:hypothetical protein
MLPASLASTALVALALARVQEHAPSPATRIEFRQSAAVDLFFHVRALAAEGASGVPADMAVAVRAAQELHRSLGGSFLSWGPIAGVLPGCDDAADIERVFAGLPEAFERPDRTSVPLRASALALAAALRQAEPAFLEHPWPADQRAVAAARARLAQGFDPGQAACVAYHLECLGMEDPGLAIPVYLTARAPFPGAFTHIGADGRGVCFVGLADSEGTQLFETVLHEVTHALDIAAPGASVFEELRRRLQESGVALDDPLLRDVPHTLMFVQAAESIRRTIAPEHQDYGDVSGDYERSGPLAERVRGFWRDHLAGKLTRPEALEGIVTSATPAPR